MNGRIRIAFIYTIGTILYPLIWVVGKVLSRLSKDGAGWGD